MGKPAKTNSGIPVRNLPKTAIDNRSGQKDPGQNYRGSHGTSPPANPKSTSKGGKG